MTKLGDSIKNVYKTSFKIIFLAMINYTLNKIEQIDSPTSTKRRNLMILFNGFIKKLKRPKYLVGVCLLFSLTLSIIAYKNPTYEPNNILYFLSSISQGLAAIFSLLFTITIFAIQMTKTPISIDKIFDKWTLLFMTLFAAGITLPLIQLVVNHNYLPFDKIKNLSLAVDLFLASFCVLSIIPYSIRINKTMLYESGLSNLSYDISEAIDRDHKTVVSIKVKELIKLCSISLEDEQWDKTCSIVKELKDIPEKISCIEWTDLNESIIRKLIRITYKNHFRDTQVMITVIEALGTIGSKNKILLLDQDQVELKLRGSNLSQAIDSFMIFNYCYILIRNPGLYLYPLKKLFNIGSLENSFPFFLVTKNKKKEAEFQAEVPIYVRDFPPKFNSYQRFEYLHKFYDDIKIRSGLILPETPVYNTEEIYDLILPDVFTSKNFISIPKRTILGLYEIGYQLSFESQHHIEEIKEILNQLEKIGVNAIDFTSNNSIVSMSSYCIYEITALSVQVGKEDKNKKLLLSAMEHLIRIAYKAYEKDKNQFDDSCRSSLAFWWILGAYANKYLPNHTKEIISKLKKSNNEIIKEDLRIESVLSDVREYLRSYQDCIENLNTFEELYNNLTSEKL